jgi:hypothetical protein
MHARSTVGIIMDYCKLRVSVLLSLLKICKCKGKTVPLHTMEARGRGGIAPTFS